MKTRIDYFVKTLLIFVLLLPCGLFSSEIKIGMSAAFSGPTRGLGIELYRGTMAYLLHVNGNKGVHGRKVELVAYDDGYNPLPTIKNTIRLVEKDDVLLLYGYVGTPTVTRMLPLLKKYHKRNMYLFFPFTGAQPHREEPYSRFVFNLRTSYSREVEGLVDNLVGIGSKEIAVFYQADAYGRSGWDAVRKALKKYDLKLIAEATYRRGTPFGADMSRQVKILLKQNPDAVISVGAYAACAAFIRDARRMNWNVPIANLSFVDSANLSALLLKAGEKEDKDFTCNLINSQVVPNYFETDLPAIKEYRELMEKYRGKLMPPKTLLKEPYTPLEFSPVSLEGFLDAKLMVEILKRLGPGMKREDIKGTVESIKGLDIGINTWINFSSLKHQALEAVYFTSIRNGRPVPLLDWRKWKK
ncbi:MAG: ABC transporter substrate-binding protein [bacterium]|nr:ABC transporter substrate-binding protein [bacterium]